MLEIRFESLSGFEFSGVSIWHFLGFVVWGLIQALLFPSFLHGCTIPLIENRKYVISLRQNE